jgi:cold shock CspA family protein
MSERLFGTVDHWVVDRSFCFIRLDDYAADVFCHVRDLIDFNGDTDLSKGSASHS